MLFLSVYYNDYSVDADAIRDRRGNPIAPESSEMEPLRQFFVKRIWTIGSDWDSYIRRIQQRRNAIHAFRTRDIGTFEDWRNELPFHLSFVRDINSRIPYPDTIYEPREY